MGSSIFSICTLVFIFQTVYTQCANRIVQGPNGPIELLPNQVLVPGGPGGVPYLGQVSGQGRPVYIPGPNPPCQPPQPIPPPGQIPAEYNMSNLPPVIANFAPPQSIVSGNVIVPNIPQAIPNGLSGNVFVPNIPQAIPNLVSGNVFVPNIPQAIPNLVSGNSFVPNIASGNLIIPNTPVLENYVPTVIHDNSVANSLANALQLLVVSNLLSNTLPDPYGPPCYDGYMPGYGYVY